MYKNILLPTDGLGKCKYGTCHGILLAKDLGAKVTAVCVTEKLSGQDILKIYNHDMLFADNGVTCEKVHLAEESPTDGILKVAKEKNCDLIFISTHGNPGLMGTLFGTVVSKILSRSKFPVLVHHCGGPS